MDIAIVTDITHTYKCIIFNKVAFTSIVNKPDHNCMYIFSIRMYYIVLDGGSEALCNIGFVATRIFDAHACAPCASARNV